MEKQYYVYIMANRHNGVLYTGVTNDLKRRAYEHQQNIGSGFTSKYRVKKLVYYEACNSIEAAISREKQIKGGSRQKKLALVESVNKEWKDLYALI